MYVDNKEKGTSTIKCNASGCKKSFVGKNHGEAWRKAKDAGWSTPNAAEAWCNDHKPSRGKAEKPNSNSKKAAKGKATAKKSGSLVRKPARPGVISYGAAEE